MSGEWFSATASRKRFREKSEPVQPRKKKQKVVAGHSDELADELWCDSQENSTTGVEEFSKAIRGYIEVSESFESSKEDIKKVLDQTETKDDVVIDLFAETAALKQITKDCSKVNLPSKEELRKRQQERKKRENSVKYVEVIREKKTRESLPGHACEMCQKVSLGLWIIANSLVL